MALTAKKLGKIEKNLREVFADDPETLSTVIAKMEGVRTLIDQGEVITKADLGEILGEVEITKISNAGAAAQGDVDPSTNPLAPVFLGLHKSLVDQNGVIRKGVDLNDLQTLLNAAYQKSADVLDTAIDAAVEATAIELAKSGVIKSGKKGKKGFPKDAGDAGTDDDGDGSENMEKLLKGLGPSGRGILANFQKMQRDLAGLQAERDLQVFTKQAETIGEGAAFATDLMKLHRVDPALAERISKRLGAKNTLLKQNAVWSSEIGGGQLGADGTAYDKLSAHANDLVSKGLKNAKGQPASFAKAFTTACEQHPELYREFQDEQARSKR